MIDESIKHQNNIEGFLLLAKNARGAAAAQLIAQATEAAGVYVFGELAQFPGIKQLEQDSIKDWRLLELFAFGTYKDYINNSDDYPKLSELQVRKLRHLTVVSLASTSKHVSYSLLQAELGIMNLRQLEDLIIETIYAGILKGKLDQRQNQIEVESVIARDIKPDTINSVLSILQGWCGNCEDALSSLETQIIRANDAKEVKLIAKRKMEQEIEQVKGALKAQSQEMSQEDHEATSSTSQHATSSGSGKQAKMKAFSMKSSMKPSSAGSSRTR